MTDSVPIADRTATAGARQHAPADVAPELYATAQTDADPDATDSESARDASSRQ
ncbi:hypothetical protein [Halobellus clavatus]|jgi:hypothetical protein|uniref:Uncharacterized protein n=1 Tax=Halobellus clavatus TaxID=660517 RepID=A0A1H3DLB4_9EURY|nr:hypothetical protein [Halobellus clavatus]SDX67302.1 hypothetical protein SAMN04487946_101649 [Halobellus clavatus]